MKIAQDRIPRPPVQDNAMYAAGESGQANYRPPDPNPTSSPSVTSAPVAGNSQATAKADPLPLQARRRFKPNLAEDPAEADSQSYHTNPMQTESPLPYPPQQHGPEYQDFADYHDNHEHSSPQTNFHTGHTPSQHPYSRLDEPYERVPDHDRTTKGKAIDNKIQGQSIANQQGPYQTVVVFLLLLMAIAIMGIVYQLFFRPNLSSEPLPLNQSSPVTSEETVQSPEENVLLSTSSSNEIVNSNIPHTPSPPVQIPSDSLSNTSPINSIPPSGDELTQASAPLPPPPTTTLNTVRDEEENALLLQSKIGGTGYWIQVGAFSSLKNANNIKQQLNQNHLESLIQESKNSTGKLYRVRVGLYASKEETERILRQLKNFGKSFENSIIIKIEL